MHKKASTAFSWACICIYHRLTVSRQEAAGRQQLVAGGWADRGAGKHRKACQTHAECENDLCYFKGMLAPFRFPGRQQVRTQASRVVAAIAVTSPGFTGSSMERNKTALG